MKRFLVLVFVGVLMAATSADNVVGHDKEEHQQVGHQQVHVPTVQGVIVNSEGHVVSQTHEPSMQNHDQHQQHHNGEEAGSHGNVAHPGVVHGQEHHNTADRDATCQAPNKQGLNALIREEIENIPTKKIRELGAQRVRTDPEVRRLAEYLTSDGLRMTLRTIQQTPQYTKLQDYACKKLFLNMDNFWDLHNTIFDLPNPNTQQVNEATHDRQGVKGLITEITKLIPTAQLKEIFLRREKSDEYLRLAVDRLKSQEFRRLLNDVRDLSEYREMAKKFRDLGLPISDVIVMIRRALGWGGSEVLIIEALNVLATA